MQKSQDNKTKKYTFSAFYEDAHYTLELLVLDPLIKNQWIDSTIFKLDANNDEDSHIS